MATVRVLPFVKCFSLSLSRSCTRMQSRSKSLAVQYKEFGDPLKVLQKVEIEVKSDLQPEEIAVKVLAAPINPADINTIQGTYGIKPKLPAIAGLEGVGEVTQVGKNVKDLEVGSWVMLSGENNGTWRTRYTGHYKDFKQICKKIPLVSAATMSVNPPTAYRMLVDYIPLKSGDTIIQNGANSGVGQAVIQIAKAMGFKTVNIVRNRANLDELKNVLSSLGADYIVTEEELRQPQMKEIFTKIPPPSLALNCVGGQNATDMMRHLARSAVMVTYGGMSRQPVTVSTTALIFKDIKVVGFWRTQWAKDYKGTPEETSMFDYLVKITKDNKLKPPIHSLVPLENFAEGVKKSMESYTSEKQILVMQ